MIHNTAYPLTIKPKSLQLSLLGVPRNYRTVHSAKLLYKITQCSLFPLFCFLFRFISFAPQLNKNTSKEVEKRTYGDRVYVAFSAEGHEDCYRFRPLHSHCLCYKPEQRPSNSHSKVDGRPIRTEFNAQITTKILRLLVFNI